VLELGQCCKASGYINEALNTNLSQCPIILKLRFNKKKFVSINISSQILIEIFVMAVSQNQLLSEE
jgi:hypothetical protein